MTNAKQELQELLTMVAPATLVAGTVILYGEDGDEDDTIKESLKVGGDVQVFLAGLDAEYDDGYGTQYLYGTLWFSDGTWADRYEYDGSERWDHHSRPEIPAELL
jgi:hypothetical protein